MFYDQYQCLTTMLPSWNLNCHKYREIHTITVIINNISLYPNLDMIIISFNDHPVISYIHFSPIVILVTVIIVIISFNDTILCIINIFSAIIIIIVFFLSLCSLWLLSLYHIILQTTKAKSYTYTKQTSLHTFSFLIAVIVFTYYWSTSLIS